MRAGGRWRSEDRIPKAQVAGRRNSEEAQSQMDAVDRRKVGRVE